MEEMKSIKVHIDLPNHWGIGGESLWADELGGDEYQIKNIPFYAYGLNYNDVVYAIPDSDVTIPEIKRTVRYSGNRTLRVIFGKELTKEKCIEIMDTFALSKSVGFEGDNKHYYALNIMDEDEYYQLLEQLDKLEEQGILEYETCEARVEGSYDDRQFSG